jgi:hypothetical protein
VSVQEDGSLALEWCSPNCRAAIFFEEKPDESGWHFVSKLGELVCGKFSELNPSEFAKRLQLIAADRREDALPTKDKNDP